MAIPAHVRQSRVEGAQATLKRRLRAFDGRSEGAVARILIAPSRIFLIFIIGFPATAAIYISLSQWAPTTGTEWWQAYKFWTWFDGYRSALTSSGFWDAMWRTIIVTGVAVGVEALLGFALAMLFVEKFRGRGLLNVLFLLPMMVVPAVSGFIFFMLLQTDGPINDFLSSILGHSVTIGWLTDPHIALFSVIITDIWQWTPLMFLIFLSGLAALPEDQINQAKLLGAGFWARMRLLVLPMMKPILIIALIIRAMEAFKLFDSAWLLTQGGPGDSTTTISVYLYRQVFVGTAWGYACAAAFIVLILVSIVSYVALRPIESAQEQALSEDAPTRSDASEAPLEDASIPAAVALEQIPDEPRLQNHIDFLLTRRERLAAVTRPVAKWGTIAAYGVVVLFPLYWIFTMSIKPSDEWNPPGTVDWYPHQMTIANFENILGFRGQGFFSEQESYKATAPIYHSFLAAGGGTLLALVIGVLAAYGIGRFRAGGRLLPFQILQLRMFPPIVVLIPVLIMWAYLRLFDTLWGLILIYGAVTFPFAVWLMRSFFQDVPRETSEAAIVDGCTHWGAFFKVVLPQVLGGLAVTALFVFILNWSDFLIAFILTEQNAITAPVFLNTLTSGAAGQLYGFQAALGVILILPPAVIGLLIQRYLVRGLTFGAITK